MHCRAAGACLCQVRDDELSSRPAVDGSPAGHSPYALPASIVPGRCDGRARETPWPVHGPRAQTRPGGLWAAANTRIATELISMQA